MSIAQTMIGELEHEAIKTRRFLERIPADQLTWKPHEKSLTAGQLALHIATIPAVMTDMGAPDECPMPDFAGGFKQPTSLDDVLTAFDESLAHAKSTLGDMDDQHMAATWKLVGNGQVLMSMPRIGFFRALLLNHLYHHRGQLGVYLRLLGAQVPVAYGPSGDEMPPEFEKMLEVMSANS